MKRKILALFFFAAAGGAFGLDMVIQYYLPSLMGAASGKNTVWNRFAGAEDAGTFSVPLEIKLGVASAGPVAFNAIGGYTFFIQDGIPGLASCNVSLGLGLGSVNRLHQTGLWGFYGSVYPLYEFPVAAFGRDPVAPWKIAVDLGFSTGFLFMKTFSNPDAFHSLYASLYMRLVGALERHKTGSFLLGIPDIGVTVGFHLHHPRRRAGAAPPAEEAGGE